MSNIVTMIPVRMASSRLPDKPLLDINGKSLLQRVFENVKKRCRATCMWLPAIR